MSKLAGIKNKSPETYPGPRVKPTVVQSLSIANNSGGIQVGSAFATILPAPLSFTPEVPGVKAVIMVSGVFGTPSPSGQVTVAIILDPTGSDTILLEAVVEVNSAESPIPFSLVFETSVLSVGVPVTIDVQAKTAAGGDTAVASGASLVIIATTV